MWSELSLWSISEFYYMYKLPDTHYCTRSQHDRHRLYLQRGIERSQRWPVYAVYKWHVQVSYRLLDLSELPCTLRFAPAKHGRHQLYLQRRVERSKRWHMYAVLRWHIQAKHG